jgi:hypothetical protein
MCSQSSLISRWWMSSYWLEYNPPFYSNCSHWLEDNPLVSWMQSHWLQDDKLAEQDCWMHFYCLKDYLSSNICYSSPLSWKAPCWNSSPHDWKTICQYYGRQKKWRFYKKNLPGLNSYNFFSIKDRAKI